MKYILLFYSALFCFQFSCAPSGRYQVSGSLNDPLNQQIQDCQLVRDSLQLIQTELAQVKIQLEKTENVLIEFYLKYEGKPQNAETEKTVPDENQWLTLQSEMKTLLKSNSELKDKLEISELKISQLTAELNKQKTKNYRNTSRDTLLLELDKTNATIDQLEISLAEKDNYLVQLINEIAELKINQTNIDQIRASDIRIRDSIQSEFNSVSAKNIELTREVEAFKKEDNDSKSLKPKKLQKELVKSKKELEDLNQELTISKSEITDLKEKLKSGEVEINRLQKFITEVDSDSKRKTSIFEEEANIKKIAEQNNYIDRLEEDLSLRETALIKLKDSIKQQNEIISTLGFQFQNASKQYDSIISNYILLDPERLAYMESAIRSKDTSGTQNEARIKILESEKWSALDKVKELIIDNEKLRREIQNHKNDLSDQQYQIDKLLTGKPDSKKYQDSLSTYAHEALRLKHIVNTLESELKRSQIKMDQNERNLDSLRKIISNLQYKRTETKNEPAISEKSKTIVRTEKEIAPVITPVQSSDVPAVSKKEKDSSREKINPAVTEKCLTFIKENSRKGVKGSRDDYSCYIIIPQDVLFEGDKIAVTQQGSELVQKLSTGLRSFQNIKINIAGYNLKEKDNYNYSDLNYKRANTISRIMNISGFSSQNIQIDSSSNTKPIHKQLPPEGIELKIYVE